MSKRNYFPFHRGLLFKERICLQILSFKRRHILKGICPTGKQTGGLKVVSLYKCGCNHIVPVFRIIRENMLNVKSFICDAY